MTIEDEDKDKKDAGGTEDEQSPERSVKAGKIAAGKPSYEGRDDGKRPAGRPGQASALYRADPHRDDEKEREED